MARPPAPPGPRAPELSRPLAKEVTKNKPAVTEKKYVEGTRMIFVFGNKRCPVLRIYARPSVLLDRLDSLGAELVAACTRVLREH